MARTRPVETLLLGALSSATYLLVARVVSRQVRDTVCCTGSIAPTGRPNPNPSATRSTATISTTPPSCRQNIISQPHDPRHVSELRR